MNRTESCGEQFLQQGHYGAVARHIRELDLVHVDVAPAALGLVHDFKVRGLALVLGHIPGCRFEALVVLARGSADDLAVYQEPDLGFLAASAAHQEADKAAFNGELFADEAAIGVISADVAIDKALAEEASDWILVRQRAVRGLLAERLALNCPVAIAVLEVFEKHVRAGNSLGHRFAPGPGGVGLQQQHAAAGEEQGGPGLDGFVGSAQERLRDLGRGFLQP